MDVEQHYPGAKINLAANAFSWPGHSFMGWSTSETGMVILDDCAQIWMPVSDVTLYAIWSVNADVSYTIEHRFILDDSVLETETLAGPIGATVTASHKVISNYTPMHDPREVISGTIAEDGSLVLKLYYSPPPPEPTDFPAGQPTTPGGLILTVGGILVASALLILYFIRQR
jgi:hypothetical protein